MEINTVSEENDKTYKSLMSLFEEHEINFKHEIHEPVLTSQQAADVRGVSMDSGAKALFLKDKISKEKFFSENYENLRHSQKEEDYPETSSKIYIYILAVMSASKQIDWKILKKFTKMKRICFAKKEEVQKLTGCLSGAVPPFGSLFGVKTIVDESLMDQGDNINFNAGLRTHSVNISLEDYLKIEDPVVGKFCK